MEEKKHILLLASTPLANDGLTKIEMDIINYNKDTIDFDVACSFGFNNIYGEKIKRAGINCFMLSPKKNTISYINSIRNLVITQRYDTVYIHGNSAMMFFEAFPAKLGRAQVVTHCHNTKSDYPIVHYLLKPFFNLLVDKKIGCSLFASKWAYCGKNIITIANGVDIERFRFDEGVRKDIKRQLGWCNNKIVGHIGRFNYQKNHEKLINVFNKMYEQDNSCRLLLIGSGELQNQIVEQIEALHLENMVKIINYTDVPQNYMQAMDIMIMPSRYEGLCLVAIEAQENGLPVLIDSNFTPETLVTEQAEAIELDDSDNDWAIKALALINNGRKDVANQIRDRKMSYTEMMDSIQNILLE